jgi:hypothetical protein
MHHRRILYDLLATTKQNAAEEYMWHRRIFNMKDFMNCLYVSEVGRACSTNGGDEECV